MRGAGSHHEEGRHELMPELDRSAQDEEEWNQEEDEEVVRAGFQDRRQDGRAVHDHVLLLRNSHDMYHGTKHVIACYVHKQVIRSQTTLLFGSLAELDKTLGVGEVG